MLTITKEFVFHAAHRLYRDDLSPEQNFQIYGKCSKLHGHSYRLQVTIGGPVGPSGMIIDFCELKSILLDAVLARYEHSYLNDLEEFRGRVPTVENMISSVHELLTPPIRERGLKIVSIIIYETPTSWATLSCEV
jgi:6-pyruvoyltetrahydropterin/6-carboxytetrahydropterin synthase